MEGTVYQNRERIRIIRAHGLDWLVEDVDTGRQYLIDKSYLNKAYIAFEEPPLVSQELYDRLKQLGEDNYNLRRRCTKLQGDLKGERKKLEALLKKQKPKQHYRNGQKKGRTRNG